MVSIIDGICLTTHLIYYNYIKNSPKNCILGENICDIYMSFFTSKHLKQVLKHKEISVFLKKQKCVLLTKTQVDDYLTQAPLSIARGSRRRSGKTSDATNENIRLQDFITMQREIFRQNVMTRLCNGIYWDDYYSSLENDPGKMDALYIFSDRYKRIPQKIVMEQDYIQYKMDQIYGIILVKKGECPGNPLLYTILECCSFIPEFIPFLMGVSILIVKTDPEFFFKRLLAYDDNDYRSDSYRALQFKPDKKVICSDKSRSVMLVDCGEMSIKDIIQIAVPTTPNTISYEFPKRTHTHTPLQKQPDAPEMEIQMSVKDLIKNYERKIQSHKAGRKRKTTYHKRKTRRMLK